jgi:type VI protein secretion system component Hcp
MFIESLENRQMFSATVAVDPAVTPSQPTVEADVQVTKTVDKSSPKLYETACTGTHVAK